MKRLAVVTLLVSVTLVAVLGWQAIARQRDYARLVAEGERAMAAGETFRAVEAYSGAIALRRDVMLAYLKRGETYRQRGETSEAIRDLRKAAELDPTATRPLELLGDLNSDRAWYARAQENYEAYVRLDDRSPRVLYKLALARHRLGSAKTAVQPLRQALSVDDRFAPAHYLLGVCLKTLEQPAEAIASLERAVQIEPGLGPARETLAELYRSARRDKEAINQLEAIAALEPGQLEPRLALGLAYSRAGRSDLAVITLRRLAEEHPENPEAFVAIGRVWLEAAEATRDGVALKKALEMLDEVARRSPPGSEALMLLGRAQLLSGDLAAAERSLKQATAQVPIEPAALLQLASVAERSGHLGTARDALMRYTAISGDGIAPPERASHLGDLSVRLNEPAAAVAWYLRASESPTATASVFARLAESQFRTGDRAGALSTVQRGLTREPQNPTLLGLQRRLEAVVAGRR
jgi:tetratricopeptide (TPR) repeat protein